VKKLVERGFGGRYNGSKKEGGGGEWALVLFIMENG